MTILLESPHPQNNDAAWTYAVPSFPAGTHTIYATFGLDTYNGPTSWGRTIDVSTDLDSQTFSGNQRAGMTVAMSSSDGILTVTFVSSSGFFGFTLVDCN